MKKIVLTSIILLIIVGCTTSRTKHTVDHGLNNVEMEANVGFPMISETRVKEYNWPESYTGTFKLELIYSGKTEDRIKMKRVISYQGNERHSYSQDLEYEYKKGQKIRINECRIQVLEANDKYIRYKILDCHFI
jgi:hypothetical protein